jgi:hypothetical protein
MWEPSTKQFYRKCQAPRVLPSSQSTWGIAAPSCIGSPPANRQSIRDGQTEHHRGSVNKQLYSAERQATTTSQPASQVTTERLCHVTAIRTNRTAHRPVETSSSSYCPKQRLALSRSTRTFRACACNYI